MWQENGKTGHEEKGMATGYCAADKAVIAADLGAYFNWRRATLFGNHAAAKSKVRR